MIVDPVEGFDSETFFLYITLAALAILVIVALQQTVFSSAVSITALFRLQFDI